MMILRGYHDFSAIYLGGGRAMERGIRWGGGASKKFLLTIQRGQTSNKCGF